MQDYTEETVNGEVIRTYADGSVARFPVPEAPLPPEPVAQSVMTKNEFLELFTLEELAAFLQAAGTDPLVAAAKLRLDSTTEVDLTLPTTQQLLGLLVQKGVLTQARMDEILGVTNATV